MVLDLPSDISVRLEEKARAHSVPPLQYAISVLSEALSEGDYEVSGFADENDTPISDEEAAPLIPGILRGLEAEAQGRYRPAADVFRDLEAKYGLHPRK